MTVRYCPSCEQDVEERDGYCLLGHPLRLQPLTNTLSELRSEVDRAFDQAQAEISSALESVTGEIPRVNASAPPPPPPPARSGSIFQAVWEEMESADPVATGDPISQFAPGPRMDWGPRKEEKEKKRRFGRSPKLA